MMRLKLRVHPAGAAWLGACFLLAPSHVVLAAPTYNGGVFVTMENLLHDLTAHGLKGRRAAYIENGSWAPTSARGMQKLLEPLNWETAADTVTLRSALRQGQQEDLERMAMQLAESVKA